MTEPRSAEIIEARPATPPRLPGLLAVIVVRAGWFPTLVFLTHLFLFFVVRLYDRIPTFDLATHFAGGVAIAYFFSNGLRILTRHGAVSPLNPGVRALLVFTLTVTAATFWEFGEFGFDMLFHTHIQVDLLDTLSDMALGIVGGLSLLCAGWLTGSRKDRVPAGDD